MESPWSNCWIACEHLPNRKQLLRCFEQIKNQPTYQTDHGNQKNDRSKVQRYFWGFWGSLTPWLMWKWLSSMAPLLTHLSCHWLSTSTTKASKKFHQHFQNVGQICMYIYMTDIYIYNMCTVYIYIHYMYLKFKNTQNSKLKNPRNSTPSHKFHRGPFIIPLPLTDPTPERHNEDLGITQWTSSASNRLDGDFCYLWVSTLGDRPKTTKKQQQKKPTNLQETKLTN